MKDVSLAMKIMFYSGSAVIVGSLILFGVGLGRLVR